MLKTVMKSSGRILACVAVVALLTGMGCINSLMFHPDFAGADMANRPKGTWTGVVSHCVCRRG